MHPHYFGGRVRLALWQCQSLTDLRIAAITRLEHGRADATKIEMFHLCPYRDLPEDIREKNRSVWVDVPSHLFDAEIANCTYNQTLDELKYAAEVDCSRFFEASISNRIAK